jgi:anti-sigma B factor antagonist
MQFRDSGPAPVRESEGGLRITEERRGDAVVLVLDGDLDLRTAPGLRVRLAELTRRVECHVVLDLENVAFIDSTGLAGLLNALRRLTRAGRRLHLVCADCPVLRILRLTRLDGTFPVFTSVDAAIAALDAARPPAVA